MIRDARIHVVRMPMLRTFGHARATRNQAENVVVGLELDGHEGAGECVPRAYVTGETVETVVQALSSLHLEDLPDLSGGLAEAARALEEFGLAARLARQSAPALAAACVLEMALLDAVARRQGVPLRELSSALGLPAELRQTPGRAHPFSTLVDFSIDVASLAPDAGRRLHHVKVKLGRGREWDVERVAAVRRAVGPGTSVSVDVNMAWSIEEALWMVDALRPHRVEWFEEPLARGDLAGYRRLREETGARVMLDESVCGLADAVRAIDAGACDLVNVRISKCGGLLAAMRIVELGARHGVGFQIGCQIGEMAVLEAAARTLAGAVRGWVAYGGPGGHLDFTEQIVRETLPIDDDTATVMDLAAPGLGVTLDPGVVRRWSETHPWEPSTKVVIDKKN